MSDEWARFLHQVGVPLPGSPGGAAKTQVTTYTLDVFNAQQDANQSALLFNIARVGGGKYFQAKNEDAIVDALKDIFAEVQRSEELTSELQSLMRISYAVFCLKKK